MAKLDMEIDYDEEDRWDGLVRLFDDVVQDCWGDGAEDSSSLELDAIDPTTGVYGEGAFLDLLKEATVAARDPDGTLRATDPDIAALVVLSVRVREWDRLGSFLGAGGRGEVCAWVARELDDLLRLDDDVGRTRPDTFALLLRRIPRDELEALEARCVQAVESKLCYVYADSIQVRVSCGSVVWEGERADRLLESAWRAAGSD